MSVIKKKEPKPKRVKRSRLPWRLGLNVPTAAIPGHIIYAGGPARFPIASLWVGGGAHGVARQVENAKTIVRAVNCHEQFIDALKDVWAFLNEEPTARTLRQRMVIHAKVGAALAKARKL